MNKEKPNYYGIIPAKIRYDNDLSNSQKLFFSELTSLTQQEGYCWASNNYFAELYDVDTSTISRWVKGLKDKGYIKVSYQKDGKQIKSRKIRPLIDLYGSALNQGGIESMQGGYCKNGKGNSTSNNNTSTNTKGGFTERLEKAESKRALLDIWIDYRKTKNKYPTNFEQDVILNKDWNGKSIKDIKNAIYYTVSNGWVTLQWPDKKDENDLIDNNKLRGISG